MLAFTYPFVSAVVVCCLALFFYLIYQRLFHPLAKYPGPVLASITDLWQVYEILSLKQPYNLTALHEKYGRVVRYGPDKISINDERAVGVLYQNYGASRQFPKTEFYEAFGEFPNIFSMSDVTDHAVRRRNMSHGFSMSSIKEFEKLLDLNIALLSDKILNYAKSGEAFDIRTLILFYINDVLGEVAFGQSFGLQETDDIERVPPVAEHTLLASAVGSWPRMIRFLNKWLPVLPIPPIQALFKGRQAVAAMAVPCVKRRVSQLRVARETGERPKDQRKDLLTSLILARDPETGSLIPEEILLTEAFGFIIAGTHTTYASTTSLLYHLLHNPEHLAHCVAEIDSNLPALDPEQRFHPLSVLEPSLPFLKLCIKENFRITPAFALPMARRVVDKAGVTIGDFHFPQGTSIAVSPHALHHNPEIWGPDHNVFDPLCWEKEGMDAHSKNLMHFGHGSRQCIGKNLAMANITKVVSTLLRQFRFELADENESAAVEEGRFKGRLPELTSVGISTLKQPLMVKAYARPR